MFSRPWFLRFLLFFAVGLPLIALVAWYAPPKERREREQDLDRTYQILADKIDYDQLKSWCGLIVTPASADEVSLLEGEALAADPMDVMCGQGKRECELVGRFSLPKDLRWYRLHNLAEPDRWIGIAVSQHHFTGWSPRWVWCRIRVGF